MTLKFGMLLANKMQSETANFAPVLSPGELDKTYASSFILAYLIHYMNTSTELSNRS